MKCKEEWRTPEWHKLREALKGNWMTRPDWCLSNLKLYVGDIQSAPIGKICVVANYLTGSLFRIKKLSDSTHEKVSQFRAQIFAEWKKRRIQQPG